MKEVDLYIGEGSKALALTPPTSTSQSTHAAGQRFRRLLTAWHHQARGIARSWSRLCLGTMNMGTPDWKPWIFDEKQSEPIIAHALDNGVNFIDLADFYSAGVGEEVVGRIAKRLAWREDLVITTKVGYGTRTGINATVIRASTSWTASMRR